MKRVLFLSLFILALSASARAADPKIENLRAIADHGRVSVRFTLANGEMLQALESGLPTSFTYIVEIFRDRPNWFDDNIKSVRIEVICTFNSVTREYLVNYRRDRKLVSSETFTDFKALVTRMTEIEERDLFEIGRRQYFKLKVRVKADLMRGWFLYVVPWEVSTKWRETRVRSPQDPS